MIAVERLSPQAHRITIMGAFHHADAEEAIGFIKRQLEAGAGGNLLLDLTALAEFSFSAISEQAMHLPTLLRYVRSLGRIAIISDEQWLRSLARLESALLPGVEYQVYDDDEAETALAWVLGEAAQPHEGAVRELDLGPDVTGFAIDGRIDRAEAERILAIARERTARPGGARLMVVVRHWHGFDMAAALSGPVIEAKHALLEQLERYAVVGAPGWMRAAIAGFAPLVKPEIRAFDEGEEEAALAWLRG